MLDDYTNHTQEIYLSFRDLIKEQAQEIERLREALRRVIAVLDRQTDDYAFARAALQPKEGEG